nr:MAG TPA: hypothetical protein [Caudoviricetes sp.]
MACIWLALLCIISIISWHIPWKTFGNWMDKNVAKEDEPVAWIMLAIAVVLWFV